MFQGFRITTPDVQVSLDAIDQGIEKLKDKDGWILFQLTSCNRLEIISEGKGLFQEYYTRTNLWPSPLFSPNDLCYGLVRVSLADEMISFCWKGAHLSVAQTAQFTQHHSNIRQRLRLVASIYFMIRHPDDLAHDALLRRLPIKRRKSLLKRIESTGIFDISDQVQQAIEQLRSASSPFDYMVSGYDHQTHQLVLFETGHRGIKSCQTLIDQHRVLYLYLRVNISTHHFGKYVLVSFTNPTKDDDESMLAAATAHIHTREIYKLFPHHIHFFASCLSEVSEEVIREKLRRTIDSDSMLLRIVYIKPSGEYQHPICVEIDRLGTIGDLRTAIARDIGIPRDDQRLVWIHPPTDFSTKAQATSLIEDTAELQKHIGIAHGDKIHLDDKRNGSNSILAQMVQDLNASENKSNISISAERRHDTQRGMDIREAEITSSISLAKKLIEREKDPPKLDDWARRMQLLTDQYEYLEIPYEDIRILEGKVNELGVGKAATVYRGIWDSHSGAGAVEVALKVFRYARLTDKILDGFREEVAMLRKLKHPNILLLIGISTNPKLMILTEYCARKSLYDTLHHSGSNTTTSMPFSLKARMMLDAARGLEYLHSVNVFHRDVKSHNLLVDEDWRIKVGDFGISKILDKGQQAFTQCGTTGWVAPEVLADEDVGYSQKADNWSFAIVMWEMVAGEHSNPFIGMAPVKFYRQAIEQNIRPVIDEIVHPSYANLIQKCWKSIPVERPSFVEIVQQLEELLIQLGMDTSLPPIFHGGY